TSLRPPLYPALLAGIYLICGDGNYAAVRLVQLFLGLGTVVLVYRLGCRVYSAKVGTFAAILVAFYPSFLAYGNFLLTETLFTFLLTGFCLLLMKAVQDDSPTTLVASGVALGLAALTRSVVWLFPPVLSVFLLFAWPGRWLARAAAAVVVFAA